MISCASILLLLLHCFLTTYCSITYPLDVTALNQNGECNNPADAKSRHDSITLSKCIEICENNDCVMIQYYDKLQSDADSRCYIFDQICDLSQNVGTRANSSHIYYKNQFTKNYCVDYRHWTDKYLDNCNAYVTHGLCLNGKMTDKATTERFEQAKEPIYGWTALDVCCVCGGGKYVYDDTAVTFVNEYNFNDAFSECSFKDDVQSTMDLAQWNNFALSQLTQGISYHNDLFIYKYLSNLDNTASYILGICNFSSYDVNETSPDTYTDFFIFTTIEYIEADENVIYFINSEYFAIDLSVISNVLEIEYYGYEYCNNYIINASLDDNAVIDMILPCFEHRIAPTSLPTQVPEFEIVTEVTVDVNVTVDNTEETETFLDIFGYYTINEDNWIYATTACGALCVLLTFCLFCCIRKCKKKKMKHEHTKTHEQVPVQEFDNIPTIDIGSESNVTEPTKQSKTSIDDDIKITVEERNGSLYFQHARYDKDQMTNVDNYWRNDPEKGPKLLFGDNIVDKKRPQGTKRKKYANQSAVLGHWDRSYGFGIPTTFDNTESVGFIYNDYNYRELLKFEFGILKKHLCNGGDVVVPYPSDDDIRQKPCKYKRNGTGKQLIYHNIGTGISKLAFTYLCVIEQNIRGLENIADKTKHVHKVLYEHDSDEYETDEKEELIKDTKKGLLVFQEARYSESQMMHIFSQHYKIGNPPKMLFGDNDIDHERKWKVKRLYCAGQADVMGPYDRSTAYGIITTFYKRNTPALGEFMKLMDKQFNCLQTHLLNGNDVVVPKPMKKDISRDEDQYCINGKQKIFHNLGTGIARLPFSHKQYIECKINELKKYARETKTVKYYNYSTNITMAVQSTKRKSGKIKEKVMNTKAKISNGDKCPWCSGQVHYLMEFKNCQHSLCERCLATYIVENLDYVDHTEDFRFKCWITKTGKCPNGVICLEDVNIPDDKCYCDECKQKNTDTGNGTILDDDSYRQFKHIMTAFGTKSRHDTDECPNPICKKPFQIDRTFRNKDDNVTNGYYYERKTSFFDDVVINQDECNCCGKRINNALVGMMGDDFDDMEEIATTAYKTVNNCRICHHFYCDTCRSNCFYEIEQYYTVRPPTPVNEAMMQFHAEQKLKKPGMENEAFEQSHSNNRKWKPNMGYIMEPFECCEVCWYRFYCRQCPHCDHRFCGICHGKWNGVTEHWMDKIKKYHQEDDDEKYGADNLYKLIDEKNGKHNSKSHHSCAEEKLKLKKKEMQMKRSKEIRREETVHKLVSQLTESETDKRRMKRRMTQKDEKIKRLENEKTQQKVELVAIKREQNAKIKELENTILKLEKKKLKDKSDILEHKLVTTCNEKREIEIQKENAENEAQKHRLVAEDERKQRESKEKEYEQFKKKLFVSVWKWKENDGKWKSYDESMNKKIEAVKIGESSTFHVAKYNRNYKVTKTSESAGTQENTATGVKRDIQRFDVRRGYIKYPTFWNMEGFDLGNDEGGLSTGLSYAEPKLVQLNITESPAKEVANAFYATSRDHHKYRYVNMKIISIQSVQNQRLYDKYWRERAVLKREIGKNKLNERDLWHGTRTANVLDTIQKEGFRKEFNKAAMWGQGTYFAVNSGYSVGFSSNNNGVRKMFQCKVLCGESILGNGGYKLTSWPHKKNGLIYDSLHSNVNDIYVIHDDVRAYPMFVVTFKTN